MVCGSGGKRNELTVAGLSGRVPGRPFFLGVFGDAEAGQVSQKDTKITKLFIDSLAAQGLQYLSFDVL
jgi:hypothetical protein